MQNRIGKVTSMLLREKADAFLVWNSEESGQPATGWLSGFTGTSSVLLITSAKRFFITDGRYTAQSKQEAKGFRILIASGQLSSVQMVGKLCKKYEIRRVIFDGSATLYSVIEDIQQVLSKAMFLSRKRVLQELRLVKEKKEIALLKKAGAISVRAFKRLIPEIRIGATEKEIAQRLEAFCLAEGAEGMSFPTIVASGKNGAFPHARATGKKIHAGELVTIDFGVRYRGYVSDMTRTVAVGKIHLRLKKMYEAVRNAQKLGCQKAKAGVTGKEIDAVCRAYLEKKNFGRYFTHSTGHGIGIEVHELPIVSSHHETRMPAGAVITCEPGVYIPNVGGARIEDALVLTRQGNLNLTKQVSTEFFIVDSPRKK